jgi:hypothetical protein
MKISKKRLIEIISEECSMMDRGPMMPEIDEEGEMAKRQLQDMEKYARELNEMLTDTTQLEAWVQAKLTKAADYLKTVKHYVEYGMEEGAYDQVQPVFDEPAMEMAPQEPAMVDMEDDMIVKMLESLVK